MISTNSLGHADRFSMSRDTSHGLITYCFQVASDRYNANLAFSFIPTPELLPLIESLYQLANFPAADVLPNGISDPLACEDCGVAHE